MEVIEFAMNSKGAFAVAWRLVVISTPGEVPSQRVERVGMPARCPDASNNARVCLVLSSAV